jgi:hypothetical protein
MTLHNRRIVGSGVVVTEARDVREFTSVSVGGVGRVILEKGSTESLAITAEDNILSLLESTVRDRVLTLGSRPHANISPTREIVYRVKCREVSTLIASGATRIEASGISAPLLSARASGASGIGVAGSADSQTVTLLGNSTYAGEELRTRITTVSLAGTSRAVVNASERVEGEVLGASTLEYTGGPEAAVRVAGVASSRPR